MRQRTRQLRYSCLPAITAGLLLAACGGGTDAVTSPPTPGEVGAGAPPGAPPGTPRGQPSPVLDASRAVSDSIGLGGGSIVATGADGTVYRLVIPATALVHPVRITLTPITGVQGFAASNGRWMGVDLQPHGLRFASALTLTIVPPGGNAAVRAQGFAYGADGSDFHLYPITPDRTRLSMSVLHFSGLLAYVGDGISIPVKPGPPANSEAALEQGLAELIAAERQAHLEGRPGDPRFVDKLEAILGAYFTDVVQPMLTRMVDDCQYAEQHAGKALGWSRTVELMLPSSFGAQKGAVMDAIMRATQHCLEEAIKPCIDWGDAQQARRVLGYDRQRELLGMDGPPNIYDPARACGDLEGVFTAVRSEAGMVQTIQATVKFERDRASQGSGGRAYRAKSGQVTWRGELLVPGCQATVAPVSAPVRPDDGTVAVITQGASQVYFGNGLTLLPNTTVIIDCGDKPQSAPYPVGAQQWLKIPAPGGIVDAGSGTMQGRFTDGVTTWTWSMQLKSGQSSPLPPP